MVLPLGAVKLILISASQVCEILKLTDTPVIVAPAGIDETLNPVKTPVALASGIIKLSGPDDTVAEPEGVVIAVNEAIPPLQITALVPGVTVGAGGVAVTVTVDT
jgi:hypothetical protein